MPNSMIVLLLVGAWLVVLVPMLARHPQLVPRTGEMVVSARVLHRGDQRLESRRVGGVVHHGAHVRYPEEDRMDIETDVDTRGGASRMGGPSDRRRVQSMHRTGRGGYNPEADVVARHARYARRRHVVAGLLAAVALTFVLALVVGGVVWWAHVVTDVLLVGYLAFLRRQTRIEQQVRLRRLARIDRARAGVAQAEVAAEYDPAPPRRLRRPGAVVLEIDDDDPSFVELRGHEDEVQLARASGQ